MRNKNDEFINPIYVAMKAEEDNLMTTSILVVVLNRPMLSTVAPS